MSPRVPNQSDGTSPRSVAHPLGATTSRRAANPPGGASSLLVALVLGALGLVVLLAGCGGSSSSAPASTTGGSTEVAAPTTSPEESADASILNTVLSRQEAAVGAYGATIPHLAPRAARMASYFRTQEQEHVDAVLKAMRGAGIAAEPEAETIDTGERKGETEWLVFLYEVENATIDEELSAIAGLEASSPRSLLAATVANQAQHLALLRGALGAGPLAQVPGPFENGTAEPPQ